MVLVGNALRLGLGLLLALALTARSVQGLRAGTPLRVRRATAQRCRSFMVQAAQVGEMDPRGARTSHAAPGGSFKEAVQRITYPVGKSTKWVVSAAVAYTLATRRDIPTLSFVVGSLMNGVLSKVLKRLLNQKRPDTATQTDPGMPSSHAQSLFFLGTYAMLALGGGTPPSWLPVSVPAAQGLLLAYITTASLWRVLVGFHTTAQVAVGAAVGTATARAWHALCTGSLNERLARVLPAEVQGPVMLVVGVAGIVIVGKLPEKIAAAAARKRR